MRAELRELSGVGKGGDGVTEHTPGPWYVGYQPTGDESGPDGGHEYDGNVYAEGDNGPDVFDNIVAQCIDSEASARLIAAAPDLLAVLQRILGNVHPYYDGAALSDALTDARAAIGKATGQEVTA